MDLKSPPILTTLLLTFAILVSGKCYAQNDSTDFWMTKAYPVFTGFAPNGLILAIERTVDSTAFALQGGLKYFGGSTVDFGSSGELKKPAYFRLELQGRWYPGKLRKVMYLVPYTSINDRLEVAAGLLMGAQPVFWGRVPLDVNIGFQSNTSTDNFNTPLFLRLNVGVGYALKPK